MLVADTLLPLLAHTDPLAPIAWRDGRPIAVQQFLADVAQLVDLLPDGGHLLNICGDRYHFMVGLAAAMCAGKISLLPSTHTPEAVRQMREFAADVFCLADADTSVDLPLLRYPSRPAAVPPVPPAVPALPAGRTVAFVFTSGSTGSPVAHAKTWGALVGSVRAAVRRLELRAGCAIVGTVPPQHMYGFESTVLLALQGGAALWSGRPFYAADIAAALAAVPEPRMLVSTPFHLRTFVDARIECPAAQLVLSATAPLAPELAAAIERLSAAPLLEIYGCTESGQLATRRPACEQEWQLLDGIYMCQAPAADGEGPGTVTSVEGDFIDGRIELGDIIELLGNGRFQLRGRSADLVNIVGKRTSLSFLNQQLLAIPGVSDGCFLLPDHDHDGVARLVAFAVADTLSAADILRALRARIDPVFLPRPLHLVAELPRNAAGKLPRAALLALLRQLPKAAAGVPRAAEPQR